MGTARGDNQFNPPHKGLPINSRFDILPNLMGRKRPKGRPRKMQSSHINIDAASVVSQFELLPVSCKDPIGYREDNGG